MEEAYKYGKRHPPEQMRVGEVVAIVGNLASKIVPEGKSVAHWFIVANHESAIDFDPDGGAVPQLLAAIHTTLWWWQCVVELESSSATTARASWVLGP